MVYVHGLISLFLEISLIQKEFGTSKGNGPVVNSYFNSLLFLISLHTYHIKIQVLFIYIIATLFGILNQLQYFGADINSEWKKQRENSSLQLKKKHIFILIPNGFNLFLIP